MSVSLLSNDVSQWYNIEFLSNLWKKKKKEKCITPMTIEQFSGMHACDCLFFFFFFGRCYYAGLHRGVPWHRQRLEVKGGTSGWLHHAHQSTSGRRRCACKVLLCFTLPIRAFRLYHLPRYERRFMHTHISTYAHKKGNRAFFLPIDNHEIMSKLVNTTRSPRMGFLFQLLVRLT